MPLPCVRIVVVTICSLSMIHFLSGRALAQSDQVCVIAGQTFAPGENFGASFPTRCGDTDEWPCFCNPDLPESAYCPYCSFSAGDGTLYCAKDGQNITFQDGSISRDCTCEIPEDPTENPIRNCAVAPSNAGCNWFDANGDPIVFEDGASFGDYLDGACGPAADWPSYCYVPPGSSGGDDFLIDYPYCISTDTASGEQRCSKSGETLEYTDDEGIELRCNCTYTPEDGPTTDCEQIGTAPPMAPSTEQPDEAPSPDATPAPSEPPKKSGIDSRFHLASTLVASSVFIILIMELGSRF